MSEHHHQLRHGRSGDSAVQRGPIVTMTLEEKRAFVNAIDEIGHITNPHIRSLYDKCRLSLDPLYDIARTPTT